MVGTVYIAPGDPSARQKDSPDYLPLAPIVPLDYIKALESELKAHWVGHSESKNERRRRSAPNPN